MKSYFGLITILLLGIFSSVRGQQIARVEQLEINSKILGQERPILIYTPSSYQERNLVAFDVIFVFDAQNRELFDLVHSSLSFITNKQFIVVGIASPAYDKLNYYRNDDFLPKPLNGKMDKHFSGIKANAANFWKYVKDEVIPYIESKYRTTHRFYAIGHSLSASFVLDKAVTDPNVFTGYIAISPNLAYENFRVAKDFIHYDFYKAPENKFIYISEAGEAKIFGKQWAEGYNMVKKFIANRDTIGKYRIVTKEFPNMSHWNGYLPSLETALKYLMTFTGDNPDKPVGNFKEVVIRVKVPDKNDDAYIAGNQQSLGNWNPDKVKLKKVSEFEREIKLKVQFPIEFKITRGSWNSQAYTDQSNNQADNILIQKINGDQINLTVEAWNDRQY